MNILKKFQTKNKKLAYLFLLIFFGTLFRGEIRATRSALNESLLSGVQQTLQKKLTSLQPKPLRIKSIVSGTQANRFSLLKQVRDYPAPQKKSKILIAGAGLSGLGSAYELMKKGHDIEIFEVDAKHVGGRARTIRFENGLYGEAGAMRIPISHNLVREYVKEFGLELRSFVQSNPDTFKRIRGVTLKSGEKYEVLNKLYKLTPEESQMRVEQLWARAMDGVLNQLSNEEKNEFFSVKPTSQKVQAHTRRSLYQALVDAGLSQEAISLLGISWGVETTFPFSLDEAIREELEGVWSNDFHEIIGGTDRLATEFSKSLKSSIHFGREIVRIERPSQNKVIVHHRDAGGNIAKTEGDWLVCTLPLGALSRIELDPVFSISKMDAIRRVNYDAATKVLAVTQNRFWEIHDGIYGGGTIWDGIMGSTWYPADNADKKDPTISQSPSILLASYTWGDVARNIDQIPSKDLHGIMVSELSKVHPILKTNPSLIQKVMRWSWDNWPWSAGAYAFFRPGEHTDFHEALVEPEDRVLLAGEHTSLIHSWMEGALESALRVSDHILRTENK